MGFRIACFLAIVFVSATWARLSLVVAAAVLPGIGVLVANAVDRRSHVPQPFPSGMPEDRWALPQQSTPVVSGEIIDD
jgi:hypothetical protein